MRKIKLMQGTPAFLEYIGPKGKKRRKNCKHYTDGRCSNASSGVFGCKCVGRATCGAYEEKEKIDSKGIEDDSNIIKRKNNISLQNQIKKEISPKTLINKIYRLHDITNKEVIKVIFVEERNKDCFKNKFSIETSLAKGVLGKKVGDLVIVTNKTKREVSEVKYKILTII